MNYIFFSGHLPNKIKDYFRRCYSLATTYLNYTQDGNYLLANLGGEHIYLYNTRSKSVPQRYSMNVTETIPPSESKIYFSLFFYELLRKYTYFLSFL